MKRRFRLVDVFGERSLTGNPLAVVIDSEGLTSEQMLEITRWLNFSETTFLLRAETPGADYKVRIFTLVGELPFAGHPTLGTCHVWQSLSGEPQDVIVQECGAGLVSLRPGEGSFAFSAPALIREGPVDEDDLAELLAVLGIAVDDVVDARWVDNGPGWVGILLEDADRVLGLVPDFTRRRGTAPLDIGVVGMYPEGAECRYEVRAFFSGSHGEMVEDPVTGSLNASLAEWLIAAGRVEPPYVAAQGTRLGRKGRVLISADADGSVWVGGRVFDVVAGDFSAPG